MPDLSSSLRDLIEGAVSPVDVDAIVQARRRRRRRRRLGIGSLVVVVALIASVSVLARPTSEHKMLAVGGSGDVAGEVAATRAALADMLIITHDEDALGTRGGVPPVRILAPASGAANSVPFPIPGVEMFPIPGVPDLEYPFLARDSNVVAVVKQQLEPFGGVRGATGTAGSLPLYSQAYALSSTFEQWRSLGAADTIFPGTEPDSVWLADSQNVREIRLDGGSGDGGRLTLGRVPIAAVAGGLLTSRVRRSPTLKPGGEIDAPPIFEVWDPPSGHAVRPVAIGATPLAVSASKAVWIDADCRHPAGCRVHITDLASDRDRVLGAAPGQYWGGSASFSPDGERVALVSYSAIRARDESKRFIEITVVDVATGRQMRRSVPLSPGETTPSWSPDGSLLFFEQDVGDLGYFNVNYPDGEIHDFAVRGAGAYTIVAKPVPSASPDRQLWEYDGPVGVSQFHSAELCIYASTLDLSPYHDGCGGPLVAGWDSAKHSGTFHLVGTYERGVFTLTQPVNTPTLTTTKPPTSSGSSITQLPSGFPSGCATPPGGWKIEDPAKVTFDAYTAVTNAARDAPGYAGTWVGPYTLYPGVISATLPVLNFAFRNDLEAHRRALREIWGGPMCVVQRGHSYAELQSIVKQLLGDYGHSLGLQLTEVGPDDLNGTVHAIAIAVSPAMRRAIDQRFGPGVVNIATVLKPIP